MVRMNRLIQGTSNNRPAKQGGCQVNMEMTSKQEILDFIKSNSDIDKDSICPHCVETAKMLSAMLDSYRSSIVAETEKHTAKREEVKLAYSLCKCQKPTMWFTCKCGTDICNWCGGHIKKITEGGKE